MTSISLPDPVVRHGGPPPTDASALERELRRRVDGEVRDIKHLLAFLGRGHFAPVTCSFSASPVPTPRLNLPPVSRPR